MLEKRKKTYGLVIIMIAALLALQGCSNQNNRDKAFTYLEKSASQESGFNDQQNPLIEEEKAEQGLYEKIMDLDITKYDQIKEYSDQALKHIDAREKIMKKEKVSIDKAYNTYKEAEPYIKKIDNKEAKSHAEKMMANMDKRYKAFQDLYNTYMNSIHYDRDLFKMLEDKNLTKDTLEKHLTKVNDAYKKIDEQKDRFNRLTDSFNDEKKQFYKT